MMAQSWFIASLLHLCMMNRDAALKLLQGNLLRWSFLNLVVVALLGLGLRSYAFINHMPFFYKNLLHGHSHFAFGGWVLPILTWLIMRYFPLVTENIAYHHWRNIIYTILLSSYGMLFSFPFTGYALVSIIFSTLSLGASVYLAIVLWKASGLMKNDPGMPFLKAGLVYLVLSGIGPLATGPIIATGGAGTPLYFNSIYFYLHFQYNGWFSFALLAVLYSIYGNKARMANRNKAFLFLNLGCVPAFFLSTLWNHPGLLYHFIGGAGAVLQIIGFFYLVSDMKSKVLETYQDRILRMSMIALGFKSFLQVLGSFPFASELAYQNRNFVIAFLHLVLLGFISLLSLALIMNKEATLMNRRFKTGIHIFFFSFVITELMLIGNTIAGLYGYQLPYFGGLLFVFSLPFFAGALLMYMQTSKLYPLTLRSAFSGLLFR